MTERYLAFDFGGTKVDIGIGTAAGEWLATTRFAVREAGTAEAVVERALAEAAALMGGAPVRAVGVSTMGITRPEGVLLAPAIPGWDALRLPERFQAAFADQPVAIENDVRAALEAEHRWGALQGTEYAAYLNLGTGIAVSLWAAGRVWPGAHGAFGEVAYWWEPGEAGFSAGHAPFEERYGGGALDRRVHAEFPPYQSLQEAFDRCRDPRFDAFVTDVWRALAHRLGQAWVLLDVEAVAIGGGMAAQFARIAPIFEAEWQSHVPFPPRVVPSRFLGRAGLWGALAVAVRGGEAP
ncbi:MAG: ROK family protein [Firmicutes bacterium]|nr:ROK family protein [Bacillota bacterium]